jgi:hypothetical protein
MFSKLIRNIKIQRNHKKRVNSIVLKSNEDIVRTLDTVRAKFLESERLEQKEDSIKYKAMTDILEWLINVS